MKKKLLGLVLTVVLLFLLIACSNSKSATTETIEVTESPLETSEVEESIIEGEIGKKYVFDGFDMALNNLETAVDIKENNALILNFSWDNTSNETTSFMATTSIKVFQDGLSLKEDFFLPELKKDNNDLTDVRPGYGVEDAKVAFVLLSKSDLEIELSEKYSNYEPLLIKAAFPE